MNVIISCARSAVYLKIHQTIIKDACSEVSVLLKLKDILHEMEKSLWRKILLFRYGRAQIRLKCHERVPPMQSDLSHSFIYCMNFELMGYTLIYVALCSRHLLMSKCPIFTKKIMLLCVTMKIYAAVTQIYGYLRFYHILYDCYGKFEYTFFILCCNRKMAVVSNPILQCHTELVDELCNSARFYVFGRDV